MQEVDTAVQSLRSVADDLKMRIEGIIRKAEEQAKDSKKLATDLREEVSKLKLAPPVAVVAEDKMVDEKDESGQAGKRKVRGEKVEPEKRQEV